MSLINCPECNNEISDKADFCPKCGFPVAKQNNEIAKSEQIKQVFCRFCGKPNDQGSRYCIHCGRLIDKTEIQHLAQVENYQIQQRQMELQEMQLYEQQKIQALQQEEYSRMAKCPRCGSTSLSGNKKGFGVGKAVVGTVLLGPIGLVAGNINAKRVRITCLNCGKRFWA